jgi:hypothetical protein
MQVSRKYGDLVCASCFSTNRTIVCCEPMYMFILNTDGKKIVGYMGETDGEGNFHKL